MRNNQLVNYISKPVDDVGRCRDGEDTWPKLSSGHEAAVAV